MATDSLVAQRFALPEPRLDRLKTTEERKGNELGYQWQITSWEARRAYCLPNRHRHRSLDSEGDMKK